MKRRTPFVVGEYYHIYNRGNSKQNIFLDNEDYDRFVKLLYLCNSTKSINFRDDIIDQKIDAWDFDIGDNLVSIGAWVLMPNHFHIYITPSPRTHLGKANDDAISLFMKKICTAYSMYFNKKYERTGTLFDNTKIELKKWFLAIWLIDSQKSISSVQLSKDVGVTQKTAWFMLQRIRNCFGTDNETALKNQVKIDGGM